MRQGSYCTLRFVAIAVLLHAASCCDDDAACTSACYGTAEACVVVCHDSHRRCVCRRPAEAMLMSGMCEAAVEATLTPCTMPTYDVLLNTALFASPEISGADLVTGQPSPAFATILRRAVSAALGRSPAQVAILDTKLGSEAELGNTSGASGVSSLLHFDITFGICVEGSAPQVGPRDFEDGLIRETQRYAAFQVSTLRVLSFLSANDAQDRLGQHPANAVPQQKGARQPAPQRSELASGEKDEDDGFLETVENLSGVPAAWCAIILTLLALLVMTGALVMTLRRRARKQLLQEPPFADELFAMPPPRSSPHGTRRPPPMDLGSELVEGFGQGTLVVVVESFWPQSLGGHDFDDPIERTALRLEQGDVVEVARGEDGWLFGHVVGMPQRQGWFPERHVSWLGRPMTPGSAPESPMRTLGASGAASPMPDVARAEPRPVISPGNAAEGERAVLNAASAVALFVGFQQGFVANAVAAFAPSEVPESEAEGSLHDSLLALDIGDVVQVTAGGGGWLQGYVVGMPDRIGMFPENRVEWLSRPDDAFADDGTHGAGQAGDEVPSALFLP